MGNESSEPLPESRRGFLREKIWPAAIAIAGSPELAAKVFFDYSPRMIQLIMNSEQAIPARGRDRLERGIALVKYLESRRVHEPDWLGHITSLDPHQIFDDGLWVIRTVPFPQCNLVVRAVSGGLRSEA